MSVHVALVLKPEDTFTAQPPQRSNYGNRNMIVAIHLNGSGYGYTAIQGDPATLRRLAAALEKAAYAAQSWDIHNPVEATDG